MSTQPQHVVDVDVLVVGGGLTGIWAAIQAKLVDPSARVMVVDKATAGKSGCVCWAGGDISCVAPEDDLDFLMHRYITNGDGLSEPDWLEMFLTSTWPLVKMMDAWGVPFERNEDGTYDRHRGRGGGALAVVMPGYKLMDQMRRVGRKHNVRYMDRIMVTELVEDAEGVAGAVGFHTQTGETYLFKAPATVLVPGPSSFKSTYIGHRMATGDGIATAYRHGAEVQGMELAVGHNTGPRDYDISGLARFQAMGGKYLNALGEEFMWRYDPDLGNKANWGMLARAMAMEVKAGRGPIYFDLTSISPEHLELSRRIIPHTFLTLERAGINVLKEKIEWIPTHQGNQAGPAGLRITMDMAVVGKPGLFTGGDTGCKPWYGAECGSHGVNLGWCCVSGHRAGDAAARWYQRRGAVNLSDAAVSAALEYTSAAYRVKDGIAPTEVILEMQKNLIPYEIAILKRGDSLEKALRAMEGLQAQVPYLQATDAHGLMLANEARNMILQAEMILRASLHRTESRGTHYREDYPQRDDANWLKWVCVRQNDSGKMDVYTVNARVHAPTAGLKVRETIG